MDDESRGRRGRRRIDGERVIESGEEWKSNW